jgi:hypothetical protein
MFVPRFFAVTFAPGTIAPEESETIPVIEAVCAKAAETLRTLAATKHTQLILELIQEIL